MSPGAGAPCFHGDATKARRNVEQGPRLRGCDRAGAQGARGLDPARRRPLPGRTYRQSRQALLRRPRASTFSSRPAPVGISMTDKTGAV